MADVGEMRIFNAE
jgi:serine/threonine protein kinase